MAIYFKIKDEIVENIIDCGSDFAAENGLIAADSKPVYVYKKNLISIDSESGIETEAILEEDDPEAVFAAENGLVKSNIESPAIGDSFVNGVFIKKDDTEFLWQTVRAHRDYLLSDSDKYVYPDRWQSLTTEQQNSLSTYRQELRDIPQQNDNPRLIKWPTNWK